MIEHRKELILFLLNAKRNTYAAGANTVPPPVPDAVQHSYREGEFQYTDTWFGGVRFSGSELVRFREKPFWAMNYYGRAVSAELPEGFSPFLKECLMRVPEFAPYRGPRYYRSGALDYSCSWTGDLDSFQGKEVISAGGGALYELYFHGGAISA